MEFEVFWWTCDGEIELVIPVWLTGKKFFIDPNSNTYIDK